MRAPVRLRALYFPMRQGGSLGVVFLSDVLSGHPSTSSWQNAGVATIVNPFRFAL